MPTRGSSLMPVIMAGVLSGCSAGFWVEDADREVGSLLDGGITDVLDIRRQRLLHPEPLPEPEPVPQPTPDGDGETESATDPAAGGSGAAGGPEGDPAPMLPIETAEVFDLERSLRTAVKYNREYQSQREQLYSAGLSTSLARFNFGPQFNSTVSSLWSDSELASPQSEIGASLGVSQILPTGGTLALTSSANAVWPYGSQGLLDSYSSSVNASITQPLLRGAGYVPSHEPLTQAERSLIYSVRDFVLFRENFSIRIARSYYDLVFQRRRLAIEDTNLEGAVFDRRKAEALYQVERNTDLEVFRARRREIVARDQLIAVRAAYQRAVDEFKILLGLPTTDLIEIADAEPPYEAVRITVDSAVAAARHNRLDIITQRQQVEDAERGVRIAENGLLPDLDLTASYGLAGGGDGEDQLGPDEWSSSIGLNFELPLQRKPERNRYRQALIGLEQVKRSYSLRLDRLDLEIRDALRQLRSIEERIVLQEAQIEREQGAVTVTEIRYESDTADNRDLLEARQALVNAKNSLIQLKVDHFIARLSLLRDMGVFYVDDTGLWQ
ncbi:MAG: TolC family protein [bacterium]|nr:TolC family protein [bacterium]